MKKQSRKSPIEPTMGSKIKFYRQRLQITQEELSLEANVGTGTVSEIENDKRIPDTRTIYKLAVALQLTSKEAADVFGVNLYAESMDKKLG